MEVFQSIRAFSFVGMNALSGLLQAQLLQLFFDDTRSFCLDIFCISTEAFSFFRSVLVSSVKVPLCPLL